MTETPEVRAEDSLAPLELDRLTIEEEAAFMNRGKGKQLMATAVIAAALVAGGVQAMRTLDRQQAELERGQAVAELRSNHVDAYLRCVAPTAPATALKSDDRTHGLIEDVVERSKKAYGPTMSRCAQQLSDLRPTLANARVNPHLAPALTDLRTAAIDLTNSTSALATYLADPAKPYDFVQATGLIDHVARAVTAYRDRDDTFRAQLNDL